MDSFTVPDLFATVIALSALVLSGWQFLVSRRDKNPKLAVAASAEMQGPPFRQNADQNPAFFAFVEVTNVGEVPVRIKSVELRFDQGRHTKEGAGLPSMSGVYIEVQPGQPLVPLQPKEAVSFLVSHSVKESHPIRKIAIVDHLGNDWFASELDVRNININHENWISRLSEL